MRLLIASAFALAFLLAGCGEDDPTATPVAPTATPVVAAPTSTSVPTATATATATEEPTATPVPPTPTSPPATVVAPPRAVVTRTPTRVPSEPATPTIEPTQPSTADFEIVIEESFDSETSLFIGETQYGTVTDLFAGYYFMIVPEGGWQNIVYDQVLDIRDGAIVVDVELQGDGAVGLVARSNVDSDGTFNFYLCWISTESTAGCHASIRSEWVELFRTDPGSIELQTQNEVRLYVFDDLLIFELNGSEVGTATDTTLFDGAWGVYAESFSGEFTAYFDYLILVRLTQ